jgi:hypothetical protein
LIGLLMVMGLVSSPLWPATSHAATPAERAVASEAGAAWLVTQFTSGGFIADLNGDPQLPNTVQSALAFAATASQESTFDAAVAYLGAHVDDYVAPGGADDSVGALGYLLLLADAAGIPGTDFGGQDLIARLQGTLGDLEPGLFGAADPTFDGVYRQGLAILGLAAHDVVPDASAVSWLTDQQCGPTSPAAAVGGWEAYRADPTTPCGPPDPINFIGPDSNSTALAVQALSTIGVNPPNDALAFLDATQSPDGGWAFIAGLDVDPNSTAIVIQALVSGGADPESAPWIEPGGSPYDSLMAWQIVSGDQADLGAFSTPFSDGFPDQLATQQAVWGTAGRAFPLGPVDFDGPDGPSTTGSSLPASTPAASSPATAPRFTG